MDLNELKTRIKQLIFDEGPKLVGVGNRERLKDAPVSSSMDYCLPGAQSCIIWAYPNPIEALENYFSKKETLFQKSIHPNINILHVQVSITSFFQKSIINIFYYLHFCKGFFNLTQ